MLSESQRQSINTLVSIHITQMGIAWARFELDKEESGGLVLNENARITHWQHIGHEVSKMHLIDVALKYGEFSTFIPPADAYVFEEQDGRTGNFHRNFAFIKI